MDKPIKIAHFVQDQKFVDAAWKIFELANPGGNTFFIESKKEVKYVKIASLTFIQKSAPFDNVFINKLTDFDIVVLHSFTDFGKSVVKRLKKNTSYSPKVLWIGMGFDYMDLLYSNRVDLLTSNSFFVNYRFCDKCYSLKNYLKNVFNGVRAYKNIDFFSPVLESEFRLVKKNHPNFLPKYVSWNYPDTLDLIEDQFNKVVSGNNILLGNSATLTNNHLEIIDMISSRQDFLSGGKLVCPLSYGEKGYAKFISKYGNEKLSGGFYPLINFMPYGDYISLISSCSVVIMNHIRQQGAGNVIAMIFLGATVYLNEKNPLYNYFLSLGVVLFSIQDLKKNPNMRTIRLSDEQILNNKKIIKSTYGKEAMVKRTENLINHVLLDEKVCRD